MYSTSDELSNWNDLRSNKTNASTNTGLSFYAMSNNNNKNFEPLIQSTLSISEMGFH